MTKIAIEIRCKAEHCANCDSLSVDGKRGFCDLFWKRLEYEQGKDFKRLPECLNAEVKE